mgnify:CR=1 FL=1
MAGPPSEQAMPDDNSRFETIPLDRRSLLASLGTAVTAGFAGCGGGGGGDGSDGDDGQSDDGGDGDAGGDGGTDGNDGGGSDADDGGGAGGGDGCPPVPSSYTREDVPATIADEPLATIGVPASGAEIDSGSATLRVEFSIGSVTVQSQNNSDTTVEAELAADATEVTDEYDLPEGARAQRTDTGSTNRVDVYIPADPDVVMVTVSASGPGDCLEGSLATIRDEMVNTIQLA